MSSLPFDCQKLLRGYYEAERLPKDFSPDRTVPDYAFNFLNLLGLIYRPVIDEYFLEHGGEKPIWPDSKPFSVCLTHDVDAASFYSTKGSIKKKWTSLTKKPVQLKSFRSTSTKINSKIKRLFGIGEDIIDLIEPMLHCMEKDPLHCFERWLEVEKEVGAHSTFFFWPGWKNVKKRHKSDCTFELEDKVLFDGQRCAVAEMMKEIDNRGWEIGAHTSWYSFDEVDELRRQKEALERVLGHEVESVRQHYLHYDIRITPRAQVEAGFRYDSTLGFNDNVGFRFGTCYPWHLYDLKEEKELSLLEVPPIIQDGNMLLTDKGMRLDEDTAFQYVMLITEAVEKVGGVLTLLWHSDGILYSDWWNLYRRTLKYLHGKNPWFASVGEIGKWWKKQNLQSK